MIIKIKGRPFRQDYYEAVVRVTCHGIKERDISCIKVMAEFILNQDIVKEGDILIPAPQREGYAIYTRTVSEIIAHETGAVLDDILYSDRRRTLYELKYEKRHASLQFRLRKMPDNGRLLFVDNVIDTGLTYRVAEQTLQKKLIPLVYAWS